MKKILAAIAAPFIIPMLVVGAAVAEIPNHQGEGPHAVGKHLTPAIEVVVTAKAPPKVREVAQFRPPPLPPLQLPDVKAAARQLSKADRSKLRPQLVASTQKLSYLNTTGKWLRATRHQKCVEVPWTRSCIKARAVFKLHTALMLVAEKRLSYELPYSNDWVTSVRIAQQVYPGTDSWLLSCSHGEGGHGAFKLNYQGSGASGWMQFMPSTFYGHVYTALADVKAHGFVLPDGLTDIHSPLGQALTAAYMRTHGMSSHWDPGIDPLCR